MGNDILLKIKGLSVHYGKNWELEGVDVVVGTGEIVALMGPNGAGKSTLLKAVFGLIPIRSGQIFWQGETVIPETCLMVDLGVAFVPQGRRVFPHLTVEENLEMGGFTIKDRCELGSPQKRSHANFSGVVY